MAHLGDAAVSYPISGSAPTVFFRIAAQWSSASFTNVTASAGGRMIADTNVNRVGMVVVNDSPVPVYIRFGAPANSLNYSQVLPPINKSNNQHIHEDFPKYTGQIHAFWDAAGTSGSIKVTEFFG